MIILLSGYRFLVVVQLHSLNVCLMLGITIKRYCIFILLLVSLNLFYRVIMQLMWMTVLAESIYLVHHTVHVCY